MLMVSATVVRKAVTVSAREAAPAIIGARSIARQKTERWSAAVSKLAPEARSPSPISRFSAPRSMKADNPA